MSDLKSRASSLRLVRSNTIADKSSLSSRRHVSRSFSAKFLLSLSPARKATNEMAAPKYQDWLSLVKRLQTDCSIFTDGKHRPERRNSNAAFLLLGLIRNWSVETPRIGQSDLKMPNVDRRPRVAVQKL
jgi:hypothetical protein